MTKDRSKQKNIQSTDLKNNPNGPDYSRRLKSKANEHTPYGEPEPSTNTTFK